MRIAEAQLAKAVSELQKEGQIAAGELVQAFAAFIRRRKLARRAGKISRALDAQAEVESGTVRVVVTSARSLSAVERKRINTAASDLLGKSGRQAVIEFREDATVIGGVRLETSDSQYDATVARAVRELHKSL